MGLVQIFKILYLDSIVLIDTFLFLSLLTITAYNFNLAKYARVFSSFYSESLARYPWGTPVLKYMGMCHVYRVHFSTKNPSMDMDLKAKFQYRSNLHKEIVAKAPIFGLKFLEILIAVK